MKEFHCLKHFSWEWKRIIAEDLFGKILLQLISSFCILFLLFYSCAFLLFKFEFCSSFAEAVRIIYWGSICSVPSLRAFLRALLLFSIVFVFEWNMVLLYTRDALLWSTRLSCGRCVSLGRSDLRYSDMEIVLRPSRSELICALFLLPLKIVC